MVRYSLALAIVITATGCPYCETDAPPHSTDVTRRLALDQAFHRDPRWLGGDGAYTIDLGDDRTLWLFGDSFIATSANLTRSESTMVRNSVAVMTGDELATATMQFAWRDGAPPTSFIPEAGDHWFWPTDGTRIPAGPLLVFVSEIRATPGEGLGFAGAGFRALRIADPSGDPLAWTLEPTAVQAPAFAPTSSVACSAVVDSSLVAVVTDGDSHDGYLARWPLSRIEFGEDLSEPEWWTGTTWLREAVMTKPPQVVLADAATECSLYPYDDGWHFVYSRGFGNTTIALRTSYDLTGGWSEPTDIFTPPESNAPNAFVYAAKVHPTLIGPDGGMLITYADNSFTFGDLFDPLKAATLYWPHVAELLVYMIAC